MAEWYSEIMENVLGPMTAAELLEKVRTGEVSFDTPIRKDDSQWVPASDVNDLFARAVASETKRVCPYCQKEIAQPPTQCQSCDRYVTRAVVVSSGERKLKDWNISSAGKRKKTKSIAVRGFLSRWFGALGNGKNKPDQ